MGAPFHFLNFKAEDAVVAYIRSTMGEDPGLNIYRTMDLTGFDLAIETPFVSVVCSQGQPYVDGINVEAGIGNRTLNVVVAIRTAADDDEIETARQRHERTAGSVFDVFYRTDLVAALNQMGVVGIVFQTAEIGLDNTQSAERAYTTALQLTLSAYPTEA